MKKLLINILQNIGNIPFLPFSIKLWLTQQHRLFRFFLPSNYDFTYDNYLGKYRININTDFPIEREMTSGEYDPVSSKIIRLFLNKDDIAIDVGANVGALSILMASITEQGTVHAFEPGPPTYSRLLNNINLNPELKKRIIPYQMGISDKKGDLFWQEDLHNKGNAGLHSDQGKLVAIDTLDSLFIDKQTEAIDFIKIDVEGMEYEVLKGAEKVMGLYKPIIYFETIEAFRTNRRKDNFQEIFTLLDSVNYKLFGALPNAKFVALENLETLISTNTLAIHVESLAKFDKIIGQ